MSIELNGVQLLQKELMRFGPVVAKKGRDTGIRTAAVHMRRELKAAAPRGKTGELKKNIGYKYSRKSGKAWVGLRPRTKRKGYGTKGGVFYYKVLDFGRPVPCDPGLFERLKRHLQRRLKLLSITP